MIFYLFRDKFIIIVGCCSGVCRDLFIALLENWSASEEDKEGRRRGVEILGFLNW